MNDTPATRIAAQAGTIPAHGVSLRDALWTWMRVAALSFGGAAGQIAVMHRILVEEKRWISEERFLHARRAAPPASPSSRGSALMMHTSPEQQ